MADLTPAEIDHILILRSMASGAAIGLTAGHNQDAVALEAGADALEQVAGLQAQVERYRQILAELVDNSVCEHCELDGCLPGACECGHHEGLVDARVKAMNALDPAAAPELEDGDG